MQVEVLIVKAKQASCYTAKKLNYLHKKRHCSFSEVSLLVVKLGSLHFFTCPFSFQVYVQIFSEKDIMESMINLSEDLCTTSHYMVLQSYLQITLHISHLFLHREHIDSTIIVEKMVFIIIVHKYYIQVGDP
jgi:hypothetical protein